MLGGNVSLFTVVSYVHCNFFFPIIRLLGNTNGRPYLSVVTNKRHHATAVLDIAQVLRVGGMKNQVFRQGRRSNEHQTYSKTVVF